MRKIVFCLLTGVLAVLIAARALTPEAARAAASDGELYGYNLEPVSLPITTETAGSALLADLNGYYLFRTPTAKNEWTGLFGGKNLVLVLADSWRAPASPTRYGEPSLYKLDRGGAQLTEVWRTDWYQGLSGQLFALLTGVIPTTVDDRDALTWTGEQDIWFPYTLPRLLAAQGYACFADVQGGLRRDGLEALGFETVRSAADETETELREILDEVLAAERFFTLFVWTEEDCSQALDALFDALKSARRLDDTVLCLVTGAQTDDRGHIYIYGDGIEGAASRRPCSALDVTPTLMNLFGLSYDSRFLAGLDVFAQNSETGVVRAVTPVVSLYGSAYSDWVTDAGAYSSSGSIFRQTADCFATSADVSAYVHDVSHLVYDRYVTTRRAMEMNYFKVVLG